MEKFWITSEALYDLLNCKTSQEFEIQDCCYAAYTVGETERTYLLDRGVDKPKVGENIEKYDFDLIDYGEEGERSNLRGITRILFLSKRGVIELLRNGTYVDSYNDVVITVNDD